ASAPAKAMQALHRSSVTTGDLRGYERVTSGFARNYATRLDGGPVALVAPMLAHLHTLLLALEQPQPPNTRRRLCVQVTQLNVLLGTAAFDLNNLFVARSYYGSALVAAEQSEEAALCADVLVKTAWAVVGRSTRSVRYADQPERTAARAREALELLGQAQGFADRDASPWTRAQLAGLRAEAYASLGQKQATEASLQQAHRAADGARPGARRYPIEFYDQARLASSEGLCYLRLHEPKLAQAALRASQALQGPTMLINRSIVQLDLAITSFQLRDVDQACEFGDQIPDVGPTHQVIAVRQHTQDLRRELAPYRSVRAVRELDERLRAIA
ncbi:MAG TPA: hypothetical protein VEP73_07285, partial [Actinomycetota bacterium]|nr:hypothetical protein [Actinomycetota bacterium]